jgi:hypothetical protein
VPARPMGTRRSCGTLVAMAVSTPCTGPPKSGSRRPAFASASGQRDWPVVARPCGRRRPCRLPRLCGRAADSVRSDGHRGPCSFRPGRHRGQGHSRGGLPRRLRRLDHEAKGIPPRASPETRAARSALGPHDTGNRWSSVGMSGHGRHTGAAGHETFAPRTSASRAARRRVQVPPPTPLPTSQASPGRASASRAGQRPGWHLLRLADVGHGPVRFTEEVATRMPTPQEARFLRLTDRCGWRRPPAQMNGAGRSPPRWPAGAPGPSPLLPP